MTIDKNNLKQTDLIIEAAIIVQLVLTVVMLFALFSRTAPHPPLEVPPFALAPFLGSSLAIGAAALLLVHNNHHYAPPLVAVFILTVLVSFGPQKYFDPAFSRIWPAVVCAQIAVVFIVIQSISNKYKKTTGAPDSS